MTITFLIAEITVEPGWAVGAVPTDDPSVDRDLLLDADGRPWVPGSALAGSLRAHLRQHDAQHGTEFDTTLMGSRPPIQRGDTTEASPLWILGTHFTPDPASGDLTEIVGQTAVDRRRGAAIPTSLRYSRSVAAGGTLTAYLRHDGPLTDDHLQVLAAWQPAIGRDRTTGGGQARLTRLLHGTIDPTTADGMRTWLHHTGHALIEAVAIHQILPGPPPQPWLETDLHIVDAILVCDPRPTGPAQPRTRDSQPFVPGSAWKGLFRGRVEYILRSRYGLHATCGQPTGCGTCPTCHVFGHPGGRGRLVFHDSPIFDAQQPAARTHVAIDRVTGGAHDGLFYQSAPVTAGRLRLRIDTLTDVPPWVATVIQHVLRDLHDGLIGLGSHTSRGMGTLRLDSRPTPGPVTIPELAPTPDTAEGPAK
ncbi:RAMP superfamily CRISPR-associated protein [Plantactinospora sp. B5E13]|uniref:RAMP superfamily CRISPR-associated protein n=1 Tax=Plantactinospora sp. B5E13 TaxID=3153758 RepID=UPI00325F51CF